MKKPLILVLSLFVFGCNEAKKQVDTPPAAQLPQEIKPVLTLEQANKLAQLPLQA